MTRHNYLPTILLLAGALLAVPATVQAMWLMKWKDTIEGEHRDVEVDLVKPSATLLASSHGAGEAVVRLRAPLTSQPARREPSKAAGRCPWSS